MLLLRSLLLLCAPRNLAPWGVAHMWLQLFRSVAPSVVAAYIGTADLQRKYSVVFSILVIQIAVFEPPAPQECPVHTTTHDADDQDGSDKEVILGPLHLWIGSCCALPLFCTAFQFAAK